jgi:hypothetical protein
VNGGLLRENWREPGRHVIMPAMVAEILISLLSPTAWVAWFVTREATWEVERVSAGETLAEASTPLAAKCQGSVGIKLKRDTGSQELHVVISAMSAQKSFHNVLTPAEFNWFVQSVNRMRSEMRALATTAAGASVKKPFWGFSRRLCGFGARTNNGRHSLSFQFKQYRSSPAYVEFRSDTGGSRACQMSAEEFVEFSGSVNHIRSKFPPGSLRW